MSLLKLVEIRSTFRWTHFGYIYLKILLLKCLEKIYDYPVADPGFLRGGFQQLPRTVRQPIITNLIAGKEMFSQAYVILFTGGWGLGVWPLPRSVIHPTGIHSCFAKLLPKTVWKWKNLDREVLDPATVKLLIKYRFSSQTFKLKLLTDDHNFSQNCPTSSK